MLSMAYRLVPVFKPQTIRCGAFLRGFFAFLLTLTTPNIAIAENFSPEQKLEAIKHALVDLALGTEISLGSAAFIDSKGILHESSHMTTQGNIRGVRVLSYLEEAGVPIANVEAAMLSDTSCPGARTDIRREALLRVSHRGTNKRLGDHYLSEVATLSEEVLLSSLAGSPTWRTRPEIRFASTYDNLVSGGSSDRVPYRFEITISDHNPSRLSGCMDDEEISYRCRASVYAKKAFNVVKYGASMGRSAIDFTLGYSEWTGMAAAAWALLPRLDKDTTPPNYNTPNVSTFPVRSTLGAYALSMLPEYYRNVSGWSGSNVDMELVLIDRKLQTPLYSRVVTLNYPRLPKGYTKSAMPPEFRYQIVQAAESMISELTDSMACTTQYYHISNADQISETVMINAGSFAGVRVGDQFLLSTDPDVLNAALNPSALASLGLARVESVNRHSAVLKYIAGPKWSNVQANNSFVALYF